MTIGTTRARGRRRFSIGIAALVVGVAIAARAFALDVPPRPRTLALLPPTGDNIPPEFLRAARSILKDHLERTGTYAVVEPVIGAPAPPAGMPEAPLPPPGAEPTAADAARVGASVGAELSLVLHVTYFGNQARLRLTAYSTGTTQVVYWDSILITGGLDQLDLAIEQLVHGMQTGKPVRESAELDTVTEKEAAALARREPNKTFGARVSELLPFDTAGKSFERVTAGGLVFLYDARSWMADLAVDIGSGAGARFFMDAAVGAYYPFLRGDFTPYLGAELRWAEMQLGGEGGSGLVLQPTAGILLGRLSSVQIRGEVGYFIDTFGEEEATTITYATEPPAVHHSRGVLLSVGIGF